MHKHVSGNWMNVLSCFTYGAIWMVAAKAINVAYIIARFAIKLFACYHKLLFMLMYPYKMWNHPEGLLA